MVPFDNRGRKAHVRDFVCVLLHAMNKTEARSTKTKLLNSSGVFFSYISLSQWSIRKKGYMILNLNIFINLFKVEYFRFKIRFYMRDEIS